MTLTRKSRRRLAAYIREMRLRRAWSQHQLAEVAGVSLRTIQRLERTGNSSHETLLAVANAFEVDVRELTEVLYEQTSRRRALDRLLGVKEVFTMQLHIVARRAVLFSGILYPVLLAAVVLVAVALFSSYYNMASIPRDETVLDMHQSYHLFLRITGLGLALYLAVWAGAFGVWRRSVMAGLAFLGVGIILSTIAYSTLPWVLYRFDQYSPGFLWILGNGGPALLCFVLVSVAGRMLGKRVHSIG